MKSIIKEIYKGNLAPADKPLWKNPKLKKLMDQSGEFDQLLCLSPDRIGGNPTEYIEFIKKLNQCGAVFLTLSDMKLHHFEDHNNQFVHYLG